jgi:hypothetical protein
MIPELHIPTEKRRTPTKTYRIVDGAVVGHVDGVEAIMQAVFLILTTERYAYPIYSWGYGSELVDLYGMPKDYCMAEIERRIREALSFDERITAVSDFDVASSGRKFTASFVVHAGSDEFLAEKELEL